MNTIFTNRSVEIVAKTIYGEARGEYYMENGGLPSLISVANVIFNRFKNDRRGLIENVCIKPKQFSCWNSNDPNFEIIKNVSINDPVYSLCLETAENVISEKWPDITKGATHYYSCSILNNSSKIPYWAKGQTPKIRIGNHLFFCL